MKILFVVNNYYIEGNGLSASARRTVNLLCSAGHDVKVLSAGNPYSDFPQPDFRLDDVRMPFFNKLIVAQGYSFAKLDKKVITQAVKWADVVHLEEPFRIQRYTVKIAKKLGVPCTATYHLHPENLFASINMENCKFFNIMMLKFWRNRVFNHCTDVQCPTKNVKDRLKKMKFTARLHEISNGICPEEGKHIFHDELTPYLISCIGRLSREKDQVTLLRAMRYSAYASKIQLYFAGRGPMEKEYKKEVDRLMKEGILKLKPIFSFDDRDKLRELAAKSDLYVHCATIEVEGLSCLESLRQGVVPIIAQGPLTATSQFALDGRSLFPSRHPEILAERIDYWLSHPDERKKMSEKYIQSTKKYNIDKSISALSAMFEDAVKHCRK